VDRGPFAAMSMSPSSTGWFLNSLSAPDTTAVGSGGDAGTSTLVYGSIPGCLISPRLSLGSVLRVRARRRQYDNNTPTMQRPPTPTPNAIPTAAAVEFWGAVVVGPIAPAVWVSLCDDEAAEFIGLELANGVVPDVETEEKEDEEDEETVVVVKVELEEVK